MAPLTGAQISIDRWSKLLLIGCVLLIVVSSHGLFSCGRPHGHHNHHGPHGFHGDHQHSDPAQQQRPDSDAAVSIAIGDNAHASASFSFSHSHEQQQPQQQLGTEGRGRGFLPHHRGARHWGRRHHSHSHEQQQPEQQQPEQAEVAVNAGTFDVKIQPARVAGIKMPEAPRAVAIPLDVPQADLAAVSSAIEKPEPRRRGRHSERRVHPRRSFHPEQKPVEEQAQPQEAQQEQPEDNMEKFPVIIDNLQQPQVDPIPPVFNQQREEEPEVRPMPLIYIANDNTNNQVHPHPQPHGHRRDCRGKKGRCCAQRSLAGLGLATGATGVMAAFRPSRCGVALFLIGVLVVEVLTLLRVSTHVISNVDQCMNAARSVDEINACGEFGRRAGITATLIIGVLAASFATCGARLGRGVVARELEERVEAEAAAVSGAILAGAAVPIVVGSCDLAPLPAYVLAVEGTACVDPDQQEGGACSV